MDMTAFYELQGRLHALAAAGTQLAGEDFRLRRALEGLRPLAAAAPVFKRLYDMAEKLTEPECSDRAGTLLDALGLADAIAVTQGAVQVPGELAPVPVTGTGRAVTSAPYSVLAPLMESLTTSGGGKYSFVMDTHEQRPELFEDYRVKEALVRALGASYSELADKVQEWLSGGDRSVTPLLRKGFDPAGKREMVRRVEVIAALEGAEAVPWLREVLPEAKKDVRAAVITALGAGPDNASLLLDLAKTERGKNREAALQALGRQDGDAVRVFWTEELQKKPESVQFLRDSDTEWAGELIAAGLRTRLEAMLAGTGHVSAEANNELARWCLAVGKKAGPAMLDFWRWADGHMEEFDRLTTDKNNPAFAGVRLTDTLQECVRTTGPGPFRDYCLGLFDSHPSMTRYLIASFHAALLARPAAEVYDKFSPYILTKKVLVDAENRRTLHTVLVRALGEVYWNSTQGCHAIVFGQPIREPLDRRWIERLTEAVYTDEAGSRNSQFYYGESVSRFDQTLMSLADTKDEENRRLLIPYLRKRMEKNGRPYTYSCWLFQLGGSPKGVLGKSMALDRKANRLGSLWRLMNDASKVLPGSEVADLLEEILASGGVSKEAASAAQKVVPWTAARLREGKSFPEWDEWLAISK